MSDINDILTAVNDEIDNCIAVSPKLYIEFVDRYNTEQQTFPKEDDSNKQISIDDTIDVQIYHRIIEEDIEENEEESFGNDRGEEIVANVMMVVILAESLSRDTIHLIKGALPRKIIDSGYKYIWLNGINIDWNEDDIVEEEFGGQSTDKFKFRFNTYAINYTLTFKKCDNCGENVISTARQELIDGLKALSAWDQYDYVKIGGGFSSERPRSLYDVKGGLIAQNVNSSLFVKNKGYKGDGAADYLNSNFIPSAAGNNMTLNSSFALVWAFDIPNIVATGAMFGTFDAANSYTTSLLIGSNLLVGSLSGDSLAQTSYTAPPEAVYMLNLDSGTFSMYENDTILQTDAAAVTATGLGDEAIFELASNNDGPANNFSTVGIGISIYGSGLTSQQISDTYNLVNTFLINLGIRNG